MPATINADNGVVSGSAGVKTTADTSGVLALQSNGSTALSISTGLVTTLTNPLPVASGGTGSTTLSGITTGTATNLAGGSNGTIPYQSASGTTQMLAVGTAGQVLQTNGVGAPSWVDVTSGVQSFTASGAITAGNGVIVNSNGTVSVPVITLTTTVAAQQTVTTAGYQIERMSLQFHPLLNVYVCVWVNASTLDLTGQVGTPASDGTITWSSETILWVGAGNQAIQPTLVYYASQQRFVVTFGINASLAAVALTVTATSVSAAAGAVSSGSGMSSGRSRAAYDETSDCVVVSYTNNSDSQGNVRVLKLSGTTITWPTAPVSVGAAWYDSNIFYFPAAAKCVLFARYTSNQFYGFIISISGSTPTIGTAQLLTSTYQGPGDTAGFAYSSSTLKAVVSFYNSSTSNGMVYGVLTISGSTLTLNNITTNTTTTYSQYSAITYDTKTDKFVWFSRNSSNYMQLQVGTLSGNTVSWGSATVIVSQAGNGSTNQWSAAYDTVNLRSGVVYFNYGTLYSNTVNTGSSNLTANNFVGFAQTTVANGAAVNVACIGGANNSQSGLTPATKYYVAGNGTLTSTANTVYGGLALSATKILVKG